MWTNLIVRFRKICRAKAASRDRDEISNKRIQEMAHILKGLSKDFRKLISDLSSQD